jgi:hypothetical protein
LVGRPLAVLPHVLLVLLERHGQQMMLLRLS